ncbi:uncharacterized protein [Leptinotarsa decemlineata]|uniref:uncharacterized protein n=1 Tax=Leptinotarsa decemlineata TaxID=7539 RepID=UPI003D304378
MQCDDVDVKDSRPQLNELDSALNELGMLANTATSKDEYLENIENKYLKMLTINTRYVSNVSMGIRLRPVSSRARYKPYEYPKERPRTRSENNDSEGIAVVKSVVDELDCAIEEFRQLKKAKSLECVAEKSSVNTMINKMSELEVVSDSIQNLKVQE